MRYKWQVVGPPRMDAKRSRVYRQHIQSSMFVSQNAERLTQISTFVLTFQRKYLSIISGGRYISVVYFS